MKLLLEQDPSLTFLLPLADSLSEADLSPYLDLSLPIEVVKNDRFAAIKTCNSAIATSGTVTLETALLGVPQVIAYKGSAISYFIAKKLVKISHIGLCNIVAGKGIVKEFIQSDATPENLCSETLRILHDHDYSNQITTDTNKIKAILTQSPHQTSLTHCVESLIITRA